MERQNGNCGNTIRTMKDILNVFRGKKVLITGDSGFKGSWLSLFLLEIGAEVFGYSLPAKTENDNFVTTALSKKISHIDGDIRDAHMLNSFFKKVNPDIAIHMAAQPLVLTSYQDPLTTFQTNVMGTVNFFEAVRSTKSVRAAINVTSDKCYDNKEQIWGYKESDAMGGKDPYSASKGCAELVANSIIKSYFSESGSTNIASVRAGNVIGGGDWSENRIIPDFYRTIKNNETLVLRNPHATRPWQFVLEPLTGYLILAAHLYNDFEKEKKFQGGWNFGPEDENNVTVSELIEHIIKDGGKGKYEVISHNNGFNEASLLKLDITKAKKFLKWRPTLGLKDTIRFTIDGYESELSATSNVFDERLKQIKSYLEIDL